MSLFKRPESPHFWYSFELKGKRYRRSTGTSVRREAEAVERRARVEAEKDMAPVVPLRISMGGIAELDIERAARSGRSPEYIDKTLARQWRQLCGVFDDPAKINAEALDAYIDTRLRSGVRRQTVRYELTVLKRGLRMAWERSLLPDMPRYWPTLASDRPSIKTVSKWHELERVRAYLVTLRGEAQTMALLAATTGARHGEMMRILPSDLFDEDGHCFVRLHGKRRGPRLVAVHPSVFALLRNRVPFATGYHYSAWATASTQVYGHADHNITMRDLRAVCASIAGEHDKPGCDLMLGHAGGVSGRYQKAYGERLARLASHVFDTLFPATQRRLLLYMVNPSAEQMA